MLLPLKRSLHPIESGQPFFTAVEQQRRLYASPSGKPGKCIDEICLCGKHHCPTLLSPPKFEGESTTKSVYRPYSADKILQNRFPRHNPSFEFNQAFCGVDGRFLSHNLESSYNANFKGAIPGAIEHKFQPEYNPYATPIRRDTNSIQSTYKEVYKPHEIKPCPASRLPAVNKNNLPTDTNHVFFDEYTQSYY